MFETQPLQNQTGLPEQEKNSEKKRIIIISSLLLLLLIMAVFLFYKIVHNGQSNVQPQKADTNTEQQTQTPIPVQTPELEHGISETLSPALKATIISKTQKLVFPKIQSSKDITCDDLPAGLLWFDPREEAGTLKCQQISFVGGKTGYKIFGTLISPNARVDFDNLYFDSIRNGWKGLGGAVMTGLGFYEISLGNWQVHLTADFNTNDTNLEILFLGK